MSNLAQHMQVVITGGMILCAAAIAVICEHLRRNNQHLREVAIELQTRCEESERTIQSFMQLQSELQARQQQIGQQPVTALPTAEAAARRQPQQSGRRRSEARRELSPATLAVIGRGVEMAKNPGLGPMLVREPVELDSMTVSGEQEALNPIKTTPQKNWSALLANRVA